MAYAVLTVLSWRVGWLARRWVVVGMGEAAIPDLVKIEMFVDDAVVQAVVGVPFSWAPVGSLWGLLRIGGAVGLLFPVGSRQQAVGSLFLGGGASLVFDGMRVFAHGHAGFWLYPVWWRPPTPNLYVSADWRVLTLATMVALLVFGIDKQRS